MHKVKAAAAPQTKVSFKCVSLAICLGKVLNYYKHLLTLSFYMQLHQVFVIGAVYVSLILDTTLFRLMFTYPELYVTDSIYYCSDCITKYLNYFRLHKLQSKIDCRL